MTFAATAGAVAAAAPAAQAAKPVKACTLATPGQVKPVTGLDVGAGKSEKMPSPSGLATEQCQFTPQGAPGAVLIISVSKGKLAATSFNQGIKSLGYKPYSGLGVKAYRNPSNDAIGFLYQDYYVIVTPPLAAADPSRDVAKMPELAKVVLSSLKGKA